jgi:exonuclease VII large subunit
LVGIGSWYTTQELMQMLNSLEEKIDVNFEKFDNKIEAKLEARDAKMEAKLEARDAKMESKIEALESKLESKIEASDAKMEAKFDALNGSINSQTSLALHVIIISAVSSIVVLLFVIATREIGIKPS